MMKGVLKDRKFDSSSKIEQTITKAGNELTFDDVQSVFYNWMSRLAWVVENGESILLNKYEMISSHVVNLKIGGGRELFYTL
jgi:hypothetical protein